MILDIIVVLFLIFSAVSGYKKGLTTILISLSGFVIAIILAFTFKTSLANFVIQKTDLAGGMKQFITEGIEKTMQNNTAIAPDVKNNPFYESLVKNMKINETVDTTANNVVRFILETAAFILIFLAVNAIAFILQTMLNIVFDLPILSSVNNMGGLGLGFIMGVLKIWIVLAIITMFTPMFGQLKTYIDDSKVTKMLYDTNVIVNVISSGIKF